MHGGGAVRRGRSWSSSTAALSLVIALTGCAAGAAASERETVLDGDTWSSIAGRVAGCDAPTATDAAGRYLRETNADDSTSPIAGDTIRYDPEVVRAIACDDVDDVDGNDIDDNDDVAFAAATTDAPVATESESVVAAESESETESVVAAESDAVAEGPADGATSVPASAAFIETFDDPASMERFDWQLHHGASFDQTLFSWSGDHDESCGAPTTTRDINVVDRVVLHPDGMGDPDEYGNYVYWCAPKGVGSGHLMTSFVTEGYAQVGFSPQQEFTGLRRICWDQNQTDLGNRKWTQVVVVPEETFVANDSRLDYVAPSLFDGPGAAGLVPTGEVFLFEMNQGSTVVSVGTEVYSEDFEGFVTTDKARRYTTCITDREDGNVLLELERETVTESRQLAGSLPDGPARVIFQDDSYNPPKAPSPVEDGFTWHWDDIVIETN